MHHTMQLREKHTAAAENLLRKNQLSSTVSRKTILALFFSSEDALEHADIEKKTGEKLDRVTVYRTLQCFLEKGIIHPIPTTDNSIRYALCKDNCTQGHHHDDHVHFLCSECGRATCLDAVVIPEIKLPRGFRPLQKQMVVTGVCALCHS